MMKQLFFTSCLPGMSLGGESGFHIRSATAGTGAHLLRGSLRHTGYHLPYDMSPDDVKNSPVRQAWLETADVGRLICHTEYVGVDPVSGRFGNFFSHVLLDVPATVSWRDVIGVWDHAFWRRADSDALNLPPEVHALPPATPPADAELASFFSANTHRETLETVLMVLLCGRAKTRVYVAAPASTVATCLVAMARVVPAGMLNQLTFSTYERDPLSSPAQLIGTCWCDGAGLDLPNACYSGANFGFNTFSGRKSALPAGGEYSRFAARQLAAGNLATVDTFVAFCAKRSVRDAALVDVAFKLHHGAEELDKAESGLLLTNPQLCAELIADDRMLAQIVVWASEDRAFASIGLPLLRDAAAQPDRRMELWKVCRNALLHAIHGGQLATTTTLIDTIVPTIFPDGDRAMRDDVLDHFTNPASLHWPLHTYLLSWLCADRQASKAQGLDCRLTPWLVAPTGHLQAFLALSLPDEYRTMALLGRICQSETITPEVMSACLSDMRLSLIVLEKLASMPDRRTIAHSLVERMGAVPRPETVDELLRHAGSLSPALLDIYFHAFSERNPREVGALVSRHGALLCRQLAESHALTVMGAMLLATLCPGATSNQRTLEFIRNLASMSSVGGEVRQHAQAWLALTNFLSHPVPTRRALNDALRALPQVPKQHSVAAIEQILQMTCPMLLAEQSNDMQPILEDVLRQLSPHVAGGAPLIFRQLLTACSSQSTFWKHNDLPLAMVALGFGAARSPELSQELDSCLPLEEARDLAEEVASRCRYRTFASLQSRVEDWPLEPLRRWRLVAKYIRPKGLRRLIGSATSVIPWVLLPLAMFVGWKWAANHFDLVR